MLGLAMTFLMQNWKPVALGLLVLTIFGSLVLWGHHKYKSGYNEAKQEYVAKLNKEIEAHKADIAQWEATVDRLKIELANEIKRRDEIIQANFEEFMAYKKRQESKRKEITNEITAKIRPTDVVIVPESYRWLYDNAACAHPGSKCGGYEKEGTQSSIGPSGKVETIDATAFAKVTIGNVLQYNEEAARCDALRDIVEEIQNGNNHIDGTDGPASAAGGDVSGGASGTNK